MKMGGIIVALVMVVAMMSMDVATSEVHHVVGGDHGWDPNSDILSWSYGRVFRVGDQICMSLSLPIFNFFCVYSSSIFPPFNHVSFMSPLIKYALLFIIIFLTRVGFKME